MSFSRIEYVVFYQFVLWHHAGWLLVKRVVYLEVKDTMKRIAMVSAVLFVFSVLSSAAELSTASSEDLLATYKQLRAIPGGTDSATVSNVVLKRDAATFTFVSGKLTFAAPIAGRVLAAKFQGEGTFELVPPSFADKHHISALTGKPKLTDSIKEAVFFFTDDTYAELAKALKMEQTAADPKLFSSSLKRFSENDNDWPDNQRKENPTMRNVPARILADLTDPSSKGFFLADFKGKNSGSLLLDISWNRDSLLLPEERKDEEGLLKLSFDDTNVARNLFGPRDENIKYLRKYFNVKTSIRGNHLTIVGEKKAVENTNRVIGELQGIIKKGLIVNPSDIDHAVRYLAHADRTIDAVLVSRDPLLSPIRGQRA